MADWFLSLSNNTLHLLGIFPIDLIYEFQSNTDRYNYTLLIVFAFQSHIDLNITQKYVLESTHGKLGSLHLSEKTISSFTSFTTKFAVCVFL
jgi:hypothetical protein